MITVDLTLSLNQLELIQESLEETISERRQTLFNTAGAIADAEAHGFQDTASWLKGNQDQQNRNLERFELVLQEVTQLINGGDQS